MFLKFPFPEYKQVIARNKSHGFGYSSQIAKPMVNKCTKDKFQRFERGIDENVSFWKFVFSQWHLFAENRDERMAGLKFFVSISAGLKTNKVSISNDLK